jgi:hypothetical protein
MTEGRFLGIRLPHALLPRTKAFETVENGVFRFDVRVGLPLVGLLAHYRGWLKPDDLSGDLSGNLSDGLSDGAAARG